MDSFLRVIARRLSVVSLVVLLCSFGVVIAPWPVEAAGTTFATAYASCMARAGAGGKCVTAPPSNGTCVFAGYQASGLFVGNWGYDCTTAPNLSNPCAALATTTVNMSYAPTQKLGTSGATWQTDYTTGAQVQCPFTISYSNYSALADSQGNFHVQATMSYNGNPSGSESTTATAGTSAYNDASGNPLAPQPSSDGSTSPQLCGGTSCADPSTGNVCSVVGGAQQCTKFPAWTPNMTGGCSGTGGAICAGSPAAPVPAQGQGGVVDPSTQIAGSDKYTAQNMQTGQVSTVVVNTYVGSAGQSVSSGAGAGSMPAANSSGSSKPASSSTAAGNGGYGSGGDCNSPPVCSGDAVMCGVGRQEWYAMCSAKAGTDQLHKDLAGDGSQPPSGGTHTGSELNGSTVDTGDTSGLNSAGLGWGTACPFADFTLSIGETSANISFQPVCDYGVYMRGFVLLLAAMTSAGILGGFKAAPFGGGGSS